jgi:hypothetical protein
VPDQIPQTQKGQLDALFSALGSVSDFTAALAAINQFKAVENWQTDQQALFSALGSTDQAGALSAIASLKSAKPPVAAADNTERDAFFALLGDNVKDFAGATAAVNAWKATATHYQGLLAILEVKDQTAAIVAIGTMKSAQGNHDALVKALGATDHATALTAATDVDKTVQQRVKVMAASAGLPAPAEKGSAPKVDEAGGQERAVTPRSRLAASINSQITS